MFPIPFNFPFINKNGSRTTIGDAISAGGGGDPYALPTASADTKGGVKIGSGLTMTGDVLSNDNPTPYSLPTASADTLGGVKVGSGLSITDGVLSASGGSGVSLTPLWENDGHYSESTYNITLSSSDYTYLICEGAMRSEDLTTRFICPLPKQNKCYLTYFKLSSAPEMESGSREVTFTDATHLSMAIAVKLYLGTNTPYGGTDNARVIPLKIYGVK